MRSIARALMALLLVVSASMVAAAQDSTPETAGVTGEPTTYTEGLDAPAVYMSERGDPVASVSVTGIERGWGQYSASRHPSAGNEYVAVTIEIENLSRGNLIAKPRDFSIVDSFGRTTAFSRVSVEDNVSVFTRDEALASGETMELTLIYEMYESTGFNVLTWQPERDVLILIDLREV